MSGKASRCLTCGEWFHVDAPWWHRCRGNTPTELTALRQQVADLRAALEDRAFIAHYQGDESVHDRTPWHDCGETGCKRARRVLAATQPQEVQG